MGYEASYKKLNDGSWGIRTVGWVPDVGDTVEVTLKSGEVKQEEVSKLIWSGNNDNGDETSICEIVKKDKDGNPVEKPKQQAKGGGQKGAGNGQAKQPGKQCKCAGCGTTDPAQTYYCGDCVLTGNTGAAAGPPAEDDNEIPF